MISYVCTNAKVTEEACNKMPKEKYTKVVTRGWILDYTATDANVVTTTIFIVVCPKCTSDSTAPLSKADVPRVLRELPGEIRDKIYKLWIPIRFFSITWLKRSKGQALSLCYRRPFSRAVVDATKDVFGVMTVLKDNRVARRWRKIVFIISDTYSEYDDDNETYTDEGSVGVYNNTDDEV